MSFLDHTIGFFSPEAALRRHSARQRLSLARSFDAAGNGPRVSGWNVGKSKATEADIKRLKDRARNLVRNNPYAATAVRTLSAYVVGSGIKPHSDNQHIDAILKKWADTTECDARGEQNLYGLQSTIFKHLMVDGEVFIHRTIDPKSKIPLKLKVIESDYLDENKSRLQGNKNAIIQGIEYDNSGKRLAYYFFSEHPDSFATLRALEPKRIPACDIIHLYKKDQASQTRGVSFFSPVMMRLKDFDDYEDAELLRQKISSCFVGFFRDLEALGDDSFGSKSKLPENLTPGSILNAPSGQTIEFSNPPQLNGYGVYAEHTKQTIAVGLGIPYMLLSGDYSRSNYSSSRMSMLNFFRYVDQLINHLMIPRLCVQIERWLREIISLAHGTECPDLIWAAPKKEMTDPGKDIEAYKAAVEAGFISHSQVIRELGDDPLDTYDEITKLNQLFDKKGLIFSTDARKNAKHTQPENEPRGNVPATNSGPRKKDGRGLLVHRTKGVTD